jgi:hypothetical protein
MSITDHHPDTPRSRGDDDAPHMTPVTPEEDVRTIMLNRVSWAAVLAGVVVSLVTQLLLNMFGLGIGLATLDPGTGDNPAASTFSVGAAIWWTLSGIIAAFIGGYVAGRLSGRPKESTTGWHGITAWAVTTLLIFYLLTSTVGAVVGGAFRTVGSAVGGITQTAATAAAPALAEADPFAAIEQQVTAASGGTDPTAMRDAAVAAVRAAVTGNEAEAEAARVRAAEALARAQNIPVEQARAQVDQYAQQYQQTVDQVQQQAAEAADTAARVASTAALFGFIALVLGAVAAWFGGRFGTVEPTITAVRERIVSRRF